MNRGAETGAAASGLRPRLPSGPTLFAGSLIWAAGLALSAIVSLWLDGWATPRSILAIGALFAVGGVVSFAPALLLARLVSSGRSPEARLAAAMLSLAAVTLFTTGIAYGVQHRLMFEEEHAELLTAEWVVELGFAMIAAFYRFAMFGVPLYAPLGLLLLFLAGVWHMRRSR